MLISPRRTFISWGSSSRLVRRSSRPIRVTRSSSLPTDLTPSWSAASHRIVLNFSIVNMRFPRPMRTWEKRAGPPESMRMAAAISASTGARTTKLMLAIERSISRFSARLRSRSGPQPTRSEGTEPCRRSPMAGSADSSGIRISASTFAPAKARLQASRR